MLPNQNRRLPERERLKKSSLTKSSRRAVNIRISIFVPNREIGNEVLMVENLSKTIDGVKVLDNITFTLGHNDKVALVGNNELAKTTFFQILMGEIEPDEGSFKWGVTTSQAYFPKDSTKEFESDLTIVDWLTQFSEIKDATYVRGFLGRMLFAGDDGVKKLKVLSGGRARQMPALQDDDLRGQRPAPQRADRPSGYGIHHSAE